MEKRATQNGWFFIFFLMFTRHHVWSVVCNQYSGINLSWVVDSRVLFYLSRPITHFLDSISTLIRWWNVFVYVEYMLLVLLTPILLINLSTDKSWSWPMATFFIPLSKLRIHEFYLQWIVLGVHVMLHSTRFMERWKNELVLYSSSSEEIMNKLFCVSQSYSYDRIIHWY